MKLHPVIGMLAFGLIALPSPAPLSATSCSPPEERLAEYDGKEVLFVGLFLGYTDLQGRLLGERGESAFGYRDNYLARFRVLKVWRGVEDRTAWVAASDDLPALKVGHPALIAVEQAPEPGMAYWVEPCSGSFRLGHVDPSWEREVFAYLGPPSVVWGGDVDGERRRP